MNNAHLKETHEEKSLYTSLWSRDRGRILKSLPKLWAVTWDQILFKSIKPASVRGSFIHINEWEGPKKLWLTLVRPQTEKQHLLYVYLFVRHHFIWTSTVQREVWQKRSEFKRTVFKKKHTGGNKSSVKLIFKSVWWIPELRECTTTLSHELGYSSEEGGAYSQYSLEYQAPCKSNALNGRGVWWLRSGRGLFLWPATLLLHRGPDYVLQPWNKWVLSVLTPAWKYKHFPKYCHDS